MKMQREEWYIKQYNLVKLNKILLETNFSIKIRQSSKNINNFVILKFINIISVLIIILL